ncbi:hypothetical protein scyTo_0007878, partial [Scyliorhinus torazame]|nr:hypothetical protein [Scyliorhinus torazame]
VLLQVMGDALGSVVVVVAATVFYLLPLDDGEICNWECYVDPSLTIIMVIIVLSSAFPLIKETAIILLQMVPNGIKLLDLDETLCAIDGVQGIHELHIWELAGDMAEIPHEKKHDRGYILHWMSTAEEDVTEQQHNRSRQQVFLNQHTD